MVIGLYKFILCLRNELGKIIVNNSKYKGSERFLHKAELSQEMTGTYGIGRQPMIRMKRGIFVFWRIFEITRVSEKWRHTIIPWKYLFEWQFRFFQSRMRKLKIFYHSEETSTHFWTREIIKRNDRNVHKNLFANLPVLLIQIKAGILKGINLINSYIQNSFYIFS